MVTEPADGWRLPQVQDSGELRKKNQITMPKGIVDALGIRPGDRVLFVVEDDEPGQARLYRMPRSFAGIAPHAYGGDTDSAEYVRAEREAWGE